MSRRLMYDVDTLTLCEDIDVRWFSIYGSPEPSITRIAYSGILVNTLLIVGTPGFEPGVTRTRIAYVTVTPRSAPLFIQGS